MLRELFWKSDLNLNWLACEAGTFKPFVRSRYSLRWRKTTENPKVWDASTNAAIIKEDIDKVSSKNVQTVDSSTENFIQATTANNVLKTSTHPTDYDYYNNEVDEVEQRN